MGRKRYYVSPAPSGAKARYRWYVKTRNSILSRHYKKSAAKRVAKRKCRGNKPSELIVQNRDGRIGVKRSYGQDKL